MDHSELNRGRTNSRKPCLACLTGFLTLCVFAGCGARTTGQVEGSSATTLGSQSTTPISIPAVSASVSTAAPTTVSPTATASSTLSTTSTLPLPRRFQDDTSFVASVLGRVTRSRVFGRGPVQTVAVGASTTDNYAGRRIDIAEQTPSGWIQTDELTLSNDMGDKFSTQDIEVVQLTGLETPALLVFFGPPDFLSQAASVFAYDGAHWVQMPFVNPAYPQISGTYAGASPHVVNGVIHTTGHDCTATCIYIDYSWSLKDGVFIRHP